MDVSELEPQLPRLRPLRRELARALEGALFPAERRALVAIARENEAPALLVSMLEGLAPGVYPSREAVEDRLEDGPDEA